MKPRAKPVRTTIIYGLLCGLIFVPLTFSLSPVLYWSKTFNLTIWIFLAGYSIILCRWREKGLSAIFFPLALLFAALLWGLPFSAFLFLSLGILSWIRSGICFEKPFFRMFVAELLVCLGGATLVAGFSPHSSLSLAMGIFLFALIQSLFFVVFAKAEKNAAEIQIDPFDAAIRKGTKIISNGIA
ncbi:MAG: hypothetical protein KKE17_15180 [Proteobacteria bacterium]|nr:hypothetical protein [Pseudomonadota bacterium]MBU1711342.1 hypothetical protein [Pseudomonadota bacterium]